MMSAQDIRTIEGGSKPSILSQKLSVSKPIKGLNEALGKLEVGDLIASYLLQMGVKYVFGVTGGAIEPFYNALGRSQKRGGLVPVVARHETGAAFMAEGYSRNSGLLGVCCSTTGPGATNLLTGVASAYEGNIPMLVITAQTAIPTFGKKPLQESDDTGVNTVGMFEYCTRYNSLVSHADQLEHKLVTAIMTAFNAQGPVHLSIPLDIMRSELKLTQPSYDLSTLTGKRSFIDEQAVDALFIELVNSTRTVFIIGSNCGDAIDLILRVAVNINAGIVTTPDGKGLVNPYHPLFKGVISFAGHTTAEQALLDDSVETVVAVGTNMGEWASNGWDQAAVLNKRLVHIDPNCAHFTRSPMAKLHVVGTIRKVFDALVVKFQSSGIKVDTEEKLIRISELSNGNVRPIINFEVLEQEKCEDSSSPLKPQWIMTQLTSLFPPNTRYLSDIGNSLAWTIHYLHPYDRRVASRRLKSREQDGDRRSINTMLYQSGFEFAPMGWAVGNSIGVSLAAPKDPIVCVVGDGAMLMSGQEITVAKEYNLPVIFLVMNDASLGMVKHGQRMASAENVGNALPNVDFRQFAESMGIAAYSIEYASELENLDMKTILGRGGPTLLDVKIDPEETPPMAIRMKVLGSAQ